MEDKLFEERYPLIQVPKFGNLAFVDESLRSFWKQVYVASIQSSSGAVLFNDNQHACNIADQALEDLQNRLQTHH